MGLTHRAVVRFSVDLYVEGVEHRQASSSPYFTRHYGLDVQQLTHEEAEQVVRQQEAAEAALQRLTESQQRKREEEERARERFMRSKRRRSGSCRIPGGPGWSQKPAGDATTE